MRIKQVGRRALLGIFLAALSLAPVSAVAETPAANQEVLWKRLGDGVSEIIRAQDGVTGVALVDLTDGRGWFHNADNLFPTASTIKLAILVELYKQNRLTEAYTPRTEDLVAESIVLQNLTMGVTKLTLRDVAAFMILVSDNGATNVLIDRLGMDKVNATLQALGLEQTRLRRHMIDLAAARAGRENTGTPREFARLLEAIYRARAVSGEQAEEILKLLKTPKKDHLSPLLPDGAVVASKPGELEGVRNDCGILFPKNRPFIACVMSSFNRSDKDAEAAIAKIGALAWRHFEALGASSALGRRMP